MAKDELVLILAAGTAQRYGGKLKQLIPIGATTILGRIMSQWPNSIVVTHNPIISSYVTSQRILSQFNPPTRRVTCDTLYSTLSCLWSDQDVTVLLGDVYYTPNAVSIIKSRRAPFIAFGSIHEIWALKFTADVKDRVMECCSAARGYRLGKLRFLYRLYGNYPLDRTETDVMLKSDPLFCWIDDGTQDVDMESEYRTLLEKVR